MEHAGFMEKGGTGVVDEKLEGRVWTEKMEEFILVNQERSSLWGGRRGDGFSVPRHSV